jgi:hypothetical protein
MVPVLIGCKRSNGSRTVRTVDPDEVQVGPEVDPAPDVPGGPETDPTPSERDGSRRSLGFTFTAHPGVEV